MLQQNIVGMAVAVGPCDSEAVAGGPVHESQFGEFAHALGAEVSGWNVRSKSFQNCAINAAPFCLEKKKARRESAPCRSN
jgi:hypothetical protein